MRDLKLRKLLINPEKIRISTLETPICEEVREGFLRRTIEASSLVKMTLWSGFMMGSEALETCGASCEVFGSVDVSLVEAQKDERWNEALSRRNEETLKMDRRSVDELLEEIAAKMDRAVVKHAKGGMLSTYESFLRAIVAHSWSVVEALIEDLHKEVVEAHQSLFPSDVVAKHDLGKTTHKRAFQFRSRDHFRDSYKEAFDNDPEIQILLTGEDISALAIVRNASIHRGGIADRRLIEDDLPKCPKLNGLKPVLNSPLILDGEIVRRLQWDAYARVFDLISEVDRWLKDKGA